LRDPRWILGECPTLKSSQIRLLSCALLHMVDEGLIAQDFVCYALIPSMMGYSFNAKFDLVRNVGPIPKHIKIPSAETEIYSAVSDPPRSKHYIPGMSLRENGNERIREAAVSIELVLTNTEVMKDDLFELFGRSYSEWAAVTTTA
jgi:hypothetical protein